MSNPLAITAVTATFAHLLSRALTESKVSGAGVRLEPPDPLLDPKGPVLNLFLFDVTLHPSFVAGDPRTLANPLVAGEFGLQFYAGVPLRTPDGYNLGTFCILDREPREFSAEDTRALQDLAAIVMNDLELRLQSRDAVTL